eukprot:6175010-Pleurochrysis_carterae.AAC.3
MRLVRRGDAENARATRRGEAASACACAHRSEVETHAWPIARKWRKKTRLRVCTCMASSIAAGAASSRIKAAKPSPLYANS